jgi:hypothetical protein
MRSIADLLRECLARGVGLRLPGVREDAAPADADRGENTEFAGMPPVKERTADGALDGQRLIAPRPPVGRRVS